MAFNTLKTGVTLSDLIRAINENFDAAVLSELLGAAHGVATLDENGFVPLSQLNLGAFSEIVVLLGVTDTPPTATAAGDQYFDTGTGLIHTWDGSVWDAGAVPLKAKLYLCAANEVWYKWTGSAMVPFLGVTAGSVQAFPFTDASIAWTEDVGNETWFLTIAVDPEGGDMAAVNVRNASGATVLVDTSINVSGGVTFLTITASEKFTGTAYVSSVA